MRPKAARARPVNLTLAAKCVNATGERAPENARGRGPTSAQAKADESTNWQAEKPRKTISGAPASALFAASLKTERFERVPTLTRATRF